MEANPLYIALVHYPVLDASRRTVATNITNFDIHDIARAARVYGVASYFIVHPTQEQQMFVSRVLDHWRVGPGQKYNIMRKTALTMVEPIGSLEEAIHKIRETHPNLLVASTSAKETPLNPQMSFREARERCATHPVLLVFGTGFGLTQEALDLCDFCIEPIRGYGEEDYRHLSVRSAVSIILDRLRGAW